MFNEIDINSWDRKEIYDAFYGYTYTVTAEIDISEFLSKIHENGIKFYAAFCWSIGKTVNGNKNFRMAKLDGKLGYFDILKPNYTLVRNNTDHLFTHMDTEWNEDIREFCRQFAADKEAAENCGRLYYRATALDAVHISIMPYLSQTGLACSKPASFSGYDKESLSFAPFATAGKYYEKNGRTVMPVSTEFHHCVNDGWHAQCFFSELQTAMNEVFE